LGRIRPLPCIYLELSLWDQDDTSRDENYFGPLTAIIMPHKFLPQENISEYVYKDTFQAHGIPNRPDLADIDYEIFIRR
jgi:hypothetical protein